ncbi:hypothetical protein EDC22_10233 [Tepidamorphus gemmatus]|uniref:Uncharacterized protein n=1 Tax=Tepidamorphus gemmatus TaxID=747076 RepID=A0A4R3MFL1_9HYPH|nr:DUF6511 domain-containing protein [Tepidamorphus gemmatus]TCT12351.1 hypothetical protein EDC22_10233 [Tepidamorphus gemmatus]
MIDPDEREQAALRAALRTMAELMAEIGWTTRFAELSEAQALALATAAVDGFQEAMQTRAPRTHLEVPF